MLKTEHRLIWLDLVRGLSSIAVCAGHLRAAVIVGYSAAGQATSIFQKIFYLATGFGHQAVMVFFVLSGYLVGGSVLKAGENFSWAKYAIARLSRLWVVLLPALLVTAIIDAVLYKLAPQVLNGEYYSMWNSGPSHNAAYSASLTTLLGNILFLQTVLTPVWGTNGPLWSLANEFWYYILFPMCAISLGWCAKMHTLASRVAHTAFALMIFFILPHGIQQGYAIWGLGLIVYFVSDWVSGAQSRVLFFIGAVGFIGSLAYSKSALWQERVSISSDMIVGAGFCILCTSLVNLPLPGRFTAFLMWLSRGLSEISYSLYLVHFPIVALIGGLCYGTRKATLDPYGFFQFIVWLGAILAAAFFFWYVFERKTDMVRKIAVRLLIRRA